MIANPLGNQVAPDVVGLANGRSVVTWEDDQTGQISALVLGTDGRTAIGSAFRVDTAGGTAPVVAALASNRFVVAWVGTDVSGFGIHAQIFDQNGAKIGNELGTAANPVNVITQGSQSQVAITTLSNGNFAMAWTDNSTRAGAADQTVDTSGTAIKARIFGANGLPVSEEVTVNTATDGDQTRPSITSGANGGFVVGWTDASQAADSHGNIDTSGTAIKAQAFDASGAKIGGDLLVNTLHTGNQDAVNLTTGSDGHILALFQDGSQSVVAGGSQSPDVSGTGIQAANLSIGQQSSGTPVDAYRFFDTHDGGHFFTTSTGERDTVLATRPDLRFEGVGFQAYDALPDGTAPAGTAPVYRFFDTHDGGHFFTINPAERDAVLATRPDLRFEGIAYYESATSQGNNTDAVYRFFDTHDGGHFFTSSTAERDTVLATRSDLHYEGVAFYAPHQSTVSSA